MLGTSFEVNTDVEAGSRVTLLDGRVSVSDAAGEIATLDPGQQVLFNKLTHKWQVKQVNAKDIAAWTTGEFIYEHAPLQQVFRDIQNWYDVTIDADLSSLRGKTITTNFKDLPLEQVLTMIVQSIRVFVVPSPVGWCWYRKKRNKHTIRHITTEKIYGVYSIR